MATVFLSGPTNSTMFTTCCSVAICRDEERCPGCGERVLPHTYKDRWEAAYGRSRRKQHGYGRLARVGLSRNRIENQSSREVKEIK